VQRASHDPPASPQPHTPTGEAALLARIFTSLHIHQGFFVEFGAWDGQRLSNTRQLREQGWSGVLIEADSDKFTALQKNITQPNVKLLHRTVQPTGPDTLDAILTEASAPARLDLLSIDIDSDDLAVWISLTRFRALLVLIEFNITIPFDVDYVNPRGRSWGNAPLTIWKFASARGYALVAIEGMNLVFLERDSATRAGLEELRIDTTPKLDHRLPRYFWGYDGTLLAANTRDHTNAAEIFRIPWMHYPAAQPLPRPWRRWKLGEGRRTTRTLLLWSWLAITRPLATLHYLRAKAKAP
jgi:hypothetical protein